MTMQPSATPEHDLHNDLLGDLDFAAQSLADLEEAGRTGDAERSQIARNELYCAIAWMRDRLSHASGAGCLFPNASGCCIIEAGGHGRWAAWWAS